MKSRRAVLMNLLIRKKWTGRYREQTVDTVGKNRVG